MPRKTSNYAPVEIPTNVSVSNGYVYYNLTSEWVSGKSNPDKKRADHKKRLIGKSVLGNGDWKKDRRMIPNDAYFQLFEKDKLPELPARADNISVGVYVAVQKLAESSGLSFILADVFGEESAQLILDLAMYMIMQESAVFQHFPHWGRNHAVFSESVRSDSYICVFQKDSLSLSKINQFKTLWARKAIDDGRLFFCYDSTNVNSQAEGVFLVQKGHAKDDPSLEQVNTDYVVRQRDGLPVTFTTFPGSVVDMAEASEMIEFFGKLLGKETSVSITMICDRGYISEDNVLEMDKAKVGFLLMLRRNMGITQKLIEENESSVKSSVYYIPELDQYGKTVPGRLFDGDTKTRYFHIIWDPVLETKHRKKLYSDLAVKEKAVEKAIDRKSRLTEDELKKYRTWFDLETTTAEPVSVKMRGRGSGKEKEAPTYIIKAATKNHERIDRDARQCGYYILVTSKPMTISHVLEAYSKRDCVEKVFMALKSFLGMDKIGVDSDDSIHAKSLIWFIAAILHSLIFSKTSGLRVNDRKSFTVPAIVDLLEEITADKDLVTGKYARRYKPIKKQNSILNAMEISIKDVDSCIADL